MDSKVPEESKAALDPGAATDLDGARSIVEFGSESGSRVSPEDVSLRGENENRLHSNGMKIVPDGAQLFSGSHSSSESYGGAQMTMSSSVSSPVFVTWW